MPWWVQFVLGTLGTGLGAFSATMGAGGDLSHALIAAGGVASSFMLGALGLQSPLRAGLVAANQKGRAELRHLYLVCGFALVLFVYRAFAFAGIVIVTENVTVTATPSIIGENVGRCLLDIENDSASTQNVSCGPTAQASSTWWPLTPGQTHTFGILVRGNCTAQAAISCVSASGSQTIHVSQEGEMPDATETVTATGTVTQTGTVTATATAISTATTTSTATATNTPKATKTATATATITNTGTPATPTNTPTPL